MAPSSETPVLNGHSNGTTPSQRTALRDGIYSPTMTFFDPDTEDLDVQTIKRHAVRLAKAGLVGLVVMGSNGEAVHMTLSEKQAVTKATREALDEWQATAEAGGEKIPVIVGASENSIRGTVNLIKELVPYGAEYALLVPPSYYRYAMDEEAIYTYFIGVADASPIPIILYNYPGAVAGIDMDSDLIIRLAQHPNIVGTKFTCGNNGKLTRVALATDAKTPASQGSGYMAFGGMADFTAQTFISGGSGIIAGGANVLPRTCVEVWKLCAKGQYEEAFAKQKKLSKADWVLTKTAIPGTKSAIQFTQGYGGYPRQPLKRLSKEKVEEIKAAIQDATAYEEALPDYGVHSSS